MSSFDSDLARCTAVAASHRKSMDISWLTKLLRHLCTDGLLAQNKPGGKEQPEPFKRQSADVTAGSLHDKSTSTARCARPGALRARARAVRAGAIRYTCHSRTSKNTKDNERSPGARPSADTGALPVGNIKYPLWALPTAPPSAGTTCAAEVAAYWQAWQALVPRACCTIGGAGGRHLCLEGEGKLGRLVLFVFLRLS